MIIIRCVICDTLEHQQFSGMHEEDLCSTCLEEITKAIAEMEEENDEEREQKLPPTNTETNKTKTKGKNNKTNDEEGRTF